MKTAMQELIDELKENNSHHYQNNKRWYDGLLAKEKQQIVDAFSDGYLNEKNEEQYYNEKFKNY